MKNITGNTIDDIRGLFTSPLLGGGDNTPAVTEENVQNAETAAAEGNVQNSETAAAEEVTQSSEAGGLGGYDFGEILGGERSEETAYTVPSPDGSGGGSQVQMPITLLVILIAAVCILGVVTIFLVSKLKKTKKDPLRENQAQAAEPPAVIAVNQNMNSGDKEAAEIQPEPQKNAETEKYAEVEKEAEGMSQFSEVPITVVPDDVYPKQKIAYEIGNVHNQGRREEQQDSFCISDVSNKADLESKGLMAVVADGMGGLESGASVSQLVSNIFLNKYRSSVIPDCKSFLYEAVMESEREVEKYIETNHVDGGSTLVAVMIREGLLSFISVGDSFIFLIRAGKLIKLNTEHTYGNLLRERAAKGEVDPEEAEINPKRASLTSYIGIGNLRLIDQSGTPIPLMDGDVLFLCSDGVYNALGDNALLEVVMGGDFSEAAERVEQSVLMQNIPTQDNFTAVMIKITGGK